MCEKFLKRAHILGGGGSVLPRGRKFGCKAQKGSKKLDQRGRKNLGPDFGLCQKRAEIVLKNKLATLKGMGQFSQSSDRPDKVTAYQNLVC
jgi:hypothetical protein